MTDKVTIEPKGDIAIVRLTNGVTNSICPEVVEGLSRTFRAACSQFRGIILAGGDKFFSIGLDLPALLPLDRKGMSGFFKAFDDLLMDITTALLPTASAVCGHAVAGGTILMLTTDFRVAASGRTLVGLNEIRIGVPVPYSADLILRQLTGDRTATELQYRGDLHEASTLQESGVVDQVVPKEDVEERALEIVAEIAALPQESFSHMKENRVDPIRKRYERYGRDKSERFLDIWFSPSAQEGLREAAKSF